MDGNLGEFRSGALWPAREYGVPIVAVAVPGTADVLPKGGRFPPAPMPVRIGTAAAGAGDRLERKRRARNGQPVRARGVSVSGVARRHQ